MRNYSYLCILALAFSTPSIAANKQFVIKLKGNTLYRESIPEKPIDEYRTVPLNQVIQELTGASATKKNETVTSNSNQASIDSVNPDLAKSPGKLGYITLQTHCLDADSLNPLDSVVMDVYANGEHITAGISDKSGFITTDSIPPGNYYVVFYQNNYKSASTYLSRTSLNSQLYMDIPLKRKEIYLYESVGQRIWKHVLSLESIPILLVIFLIIFLYKKVISFAI